MENWEVYKKPSKRTVSKKYISITKSKTFGLPRTFLDAYKVKDNLKAVILYNQSEKKIALRFSTSDPDFGYSLKFGKDPAHGAMIIARKFFDDKDIDASSYAGHYDDFEKIPMSELGFSSVEGDVFVIKLRERKDSKKEAPKHPEKVDAVVPEVKF